MKRLHWIIVLACSGVMVLAAQGQSQGKGKPPKGKGKPEVTAHASESAARASIRFGVEESRIIREYYQPRIQQLPPGLEKKVARGGVLPPGWQKKVRAFPGELDGRLKRLPAGYSRVVSGPVAMLIHDATNTVMDILELTR